MLQFKRYYWFVGLVILFRACIGFLEMQTLVSLRSPLSCKFHVNFFVQVIEADVLDGPAVVFPVVMAFQCAKLAHLRSEAYPLKCIKYC